MRKPIFLLAALLLAGPAAAEIYKCPDANGKVKFQDQPCQGASKNENKVAESQYGPRWPAGHKSIAISLCRSGASRQLGVSEYDLPEIGPILDSCNCIFDRLEKQYTADYFLSNQHEIRTRVNQLIAGPCSPKLQ